MSWQFKLRINFLVLQYFSAKINVRELLFTNLERITSVAGAIRQYSPAARMMVAAPET